MRAFILILLLLLLSSLRAADDINLQELILPSDVGELGKSSGSVYYSKSVSNKALIPTHFWGEIGKNGLHFVPQGTNLVQGLSLAGGPTGAAVLEKVEVTRRDKKTNDVKRFNFDLEKGGENSAHEFELKAGDIVFVEKNWFHEDRAYYTGLIGVLATTFSAILLYRQVKKNQQ